MLNKLLTLPCRGEKYNKKFGKPFISDCFRENNGEVIVWFTDGVDVTHLHLSSGFWNFLQNFLAAWGLLRHEFERLLDDGCEFAFCHSLLIILVNFDTKMGFSILKMKDDWS